MVTATQTVPHIFCGGSGSVSRSAIAYLNPESGFSIGTYLANVNAQLQLPVLNGMLGSLGPSMSPLWATRAWPTRTSPSTS